MYGQYKSVLDCPKCKYQSVQFDPFLMVSLPIVNSKKKRVELVFIKNHVEEIKITLSYDSGEKRTMQWAYE
jgi:ubiquitin C-terminal hydrolase